MTSERVPGSSRAFQSDVGTFFRGRRSVANCRRVVDNPYIIFYQVSAEEHFFLLEMWTFLFSVACWPRRLPCSHNRLHGLTISFRFQLVSQLFDSFNGRISDFR